MKVFIFWLLKCISGLYCIGVFISTAIMSWKHWDTVEGLTGHWDMIVINLWMSWFWPLHLSEYLGS